MTSLFARTGPLYRGGQAPKARCSPVERPLCPFQAQRRAHAWAWSLGRSRLRKGAVGASGRPRP
eukprot:1228035-Alexandrium_andersonii.AAC.1